MADKEKSDQAAEAPAPKAASGGGGAGLVPVILIVLVGVPLICYLMIEFLVMPKLLAAAPHGGGGEAGAHASPGAHGARGAAGKEATADFGKLMVNVAGSGESRYLRVNVVLASSNPELKELIKSNDVALRDAALTVLASQSLADLEKSDGREVTRRALLSRLNGILGGPIVTQIYFTEFVIQ